MVQAPGTKAAPTDTHDCLSISPLDSTISEPRLTIFCLIGHSSFTNSHRTEPSFLSFVLCVDLDSEPPERSPVGGGGR